MEDCSRLFNVKRIDLATVCCCHSGNTRRFSADLFVCFQYESFQNNFSANQQRKLFIMTADLKPNAFKWMKEIPPRQRRAVEGYLFEIRSHCPSNNFYNHSETISMLIALYHFDIHEKWLCGGSAAVLLNKTGSEAIIGLNSTFNSIQRLQPTVCNQSNCSLLILSSTGRNLIRYRNCVWLEHYQSQSGCHL